MFETAHRHGVVYQNLHTHMTMYVKKWRRGTSFYSEHVSQPSNQ